jgi:Tfp pilus assembly major pilin PilA
MRRKSRRGAILARVSLRSYINYLCKEYKVTLVLTAIEVCRQIEIDMSESISLSNELETEIEIKTIEHRHKHIKEALDAIARYK